MGYLRRRDTSENGAMLLLAMVFVLGIGLALAGLVSLTGENLLATGQIQSERDAEYSADGVVEGAIQMIRSVAPSPPASPTCPNFPSGGSGLLVNQDSPSLIAACSMGSFASTGTTSGRFVQFAACRSSNSTFSACLANALLVAEVEYVDTGCQTGTDLNCQYGSSVTIESWIVERANA